MSSVIFSRATRLARSAAKTTLPRCLLIRLGHGGPPGRWNPDWRASPKLPVTMEERIAAAKKYNLHPADYQLHGEVKEDKFEGGWGDYPELPAISYDERDPYEPWDYPRHRRNYGEPLHIDFDMYIAERVDTRKERYGFFQMWGAFLGVMGAGFLLYYYTHNFYMFQPTLPKQYPYNDLWVEKGGDPDCMPIRKNYTFELEGVDHTTPIRWV